MKNKMYVCIALSSLCLLASCGGKNNETASSTSGGSDHEEPIPTPIPTVEYTTTPKLVSLLNKQVKSVNIVDFNDKWIDFIYAGGAYRFENKTNLDLLKPLPINWPLVSFSANGESFCGTYIFNNRIPTSFCLGDNTHGQLGDGTFKNHDELKSIGVTSTNPSGLNFSYISVTKNDLVCGIAVDASIYCWGKNALETDGQPKDFSSPIKIINMQEINPISVGNDYVCFNSYKENLEGIYCFNIYNSYSSISELKPLIKGRFNNLTSDGTNTCAISQDDFSVWCWGSNQFGQLGDGSNVDSNNAVRVKIDAKFSSISVSEDTVCGLEFSGNIYCWGRGDEGQLGNGKTENSNLPVKVSNINYFQSVKTSQNNTCAADKFSNLWCWGKGDWK